VPPAQARFAGRDGEGEALMMGEWSILLLTAPPAVPLLAVL